MSITQCCTGSFPLSHFTTLLLYFLHSLPLILLYTDPQPHRYYHTAYTGKWGKSRAQKATCQYIQGETRAYRTESSSPYRNLETPPNISHSPVASFPLGTNSPAETSRWRSPHLQTAYDGGDACIEIHEWTIV